MQGPEGKDGDNIVSSWLDLAGEQYRGSWEVVRGRSEPRAEADCWGLWHSGTLNIILEGMGRGAVRIPGQVVVLVAEEPPWLDPEQWMAGTQNMQGGLRDAHPGRGEGGYCGS